MRPFHVLRRLTLVAGSSAALAALASCSGSERTTDTPIGGTLVVNMGLDAGGLFPLMVTDETARALTDQMFDRLAEIPDDLNTVGDRGYTPRLAERWEWGADSMSLAFLIDPQARWHDGRPVRASDVRFTINLARDSAFQSPAAHSMTSIDSVSVGDSLTAVYWFNRRAPESFYEAVYHTPIVPEHVYGAVPAGDLARSELLRNPVGSGPFRFVKWEPGARIEIVADTAHYRGRPPLDRVIWNIVSVPTTAASQILAGEADMYAAFPLDQAARLDSTAIARPIENRLMAFTFFGFNLRDPANLSRPHPVFGDVRVRRALSMAVDRTAMAQNVFGDRGLVGRGPFPRTLSVADTTITLPGYDTTAAGALLDSAGWTRGASGMRTRNGRPLRFTALVFSGSALRSRYAVLMQEQFRRLGVQMDIDPVAQGFFERQNAGDFDAVTAAINVDPSVSGVKQVWTTTGIGQFNFLRYTNPAVDALVDSATQAFDPARARAYASRAFQTIANDAPAIWLFDVITVAALHRRVQPKPFRPDGWWSHLDGWSIPADRRIDRDRIGLAPARP